MPAAARPVAPDGGAAGARLRLRQCCGWSLCAPLLRALLPAGGCHRGRHRGWHILLPPQLLMGFGARRIRLCAVVQDLLFLGCHFAYICTTTLVLNLGCHVVQPICSTCVCGMAEQAAGTVVLGARCCAHIRCAQSVISRSMHAAGRVMYMHSVYAELTQRTNARNAAHASCLFVIRAGSVKPTLPVSPPAKSSHRGALHRFLASAGSSQQTHTMLKRWPRAVAPGRPQAC